MADSEDRMDTEGHEEGKRDNESGRPGRRTSKVWQVFTRLDDNNAQCSLCSRTLSFKSSVTNLSKHIQRKHGSAYVSMCAGDEDPREGLKEFITIESGHDPTSHDLDEGEEDHLRSDDTDWVPLSKSSKKSVSQSKKVIKKEVISSNGVDYVIYTHDQPVTRPTPSPAPKRSATTTPQRSMTVARSSGLSPVSAPRPPSCSTAEEDEFATFAKFLSQRIRALKNPYWQSCAINEINSALHRIEMRRYEVPKVDCAQSFAQTDPLAVPGGAHTIIADPINSPNHVVEVITQDDVL